MSKISSRRRESWISLDPTIRQQAAFVVALTLVGVSIAAGLLLAAL